MIEAIIFDWHGVLDKVTYKKFSEQVLNGDYTPFELCFDDPFEEIHQLGQEYAAGQIDQHLFWLQIGSWDEPEDLNQAEKYLLSIQKDERLWSFLPTLADNYSLFILSDCPEEKTAIIKQETDLSQFAETYFSSDHRLLKSDRTFFYKLLDETGYRAGQCLFVDDSEANIAYAKKLGFETHLFTTTKVFQEYLSNK